MTDRRHQVDWLHPTFVNIFLVGMTGVGKTSVGRELALRIGWRFVDLDEEIAATAGMSIAAIFASKGEHYFRRFESRMLDRMTRTEGVVLATGPPVPI